MLNFENIFKKKKERIKANDSTLSYIEILASSLVLYSEIDEKFANEFRRMIKESKIERVSGKTKKLGRLSLLTVPPDTSIAYQRAEWLIKQMEMDNSPKNEPASSLLFDFVKDAPISIPKHLVVGVAAFAVPGVTLGKFKKRVLQIILNKNFILKTEELELAKTVSHASTGVLSPALKRSKFNANDLEPDIAEWIFGDRKISFFSAEDNELKKIEKDLINSEVIHSVSSANGQIAVIAVSPAVNSKYARSAWNINFIK